MWLISLTHATHTDCSRIVAALYHYTLAQNQGFSPVLILQLSLRLEFESKILF